MGQLASLALPLVLQVPEAQEQLLAFGIKPVRLLGALGQLMKGGFVLGPELVALALGLFQLIQPQGDFQHPQLLPQGQILPGLLRLSLEGGALKLQLLQLIGHPQEIFLGTLQLSLGLLLLVAAVGDARGLLKDLPPLGAPGGEDLVDPPLADEGVALLPQAGVHEQLADVPQADLLAVYVVFALPGPVIPAGDGDLVLLVRAQILAAGEGEGDLGKPLSPAPLGAAEDHVLHPAPPKLPGGLLPQNPADGVGQVGLAAAVGPHNGGDGMVEGEHRLVGKGLEALEFQCFQLQAPPPLIIKKIIIQFIIATYPVFCNGQRKKERKAHHRKNGGALTGPNQLNLHPMLISLIHSFVSPSII